jgi:hypothetical protein
VYVKRWQTQCGRQAHQLRGNNRYLQWVCKSVKVSNGSIVDSDAWQCGFLITMCFDKATGWWKVGKCSPNHTNACLQQATATASSLRGIVSQLAGGGESLRPAHVRGLLLSVHGVRAETKEVGRALAFVRQQTRAAFNRDVQLLPSTVDAINAQATA